MSTGTQPLLLTAEELTALTGLRQVKRMCTWLSGRGWVFEPPRARGDIPKVDRAYYLAKMSGLDPQTPPVTRQKPVRGFFGSNR